MKILIILLIVVAVLFIVLMVWGSNKNASGGPPNADNFQPDAFMSGLNSLLAPFAPKMDPKQLQPPFTACNLQAKQSCKLTVLPDPNHKIRQAKFKIQPASKSPCAYIIFQSSGKDDPQQQDSRKSKKNPSEVTFAIFKEGGTLEIDRTTALNSGLCQVSME